MWACPPGSLDPNPANMFATDLLNEKNNKTYKHTFLRAFGNFTISFCIFTCQPVEKWKKWKLIFCRFITFNTACENWIAIGETYQNTYFNNGNHERQRDRLMRTKRRQIHITRPLWVRQNHLYRIHIIKL